MSGFPADAPPRRPSMVDVLRHGAAGAKGGVGARALRDLSWRQTYAGAATYELDLACGATLSLRQTKRGELEGLGTGGTVWPAAHVLARHLERRFAGARTPWSALDLGAGTGAGGLAAAALGAEAVALTDLEPVLWLARENVERNRSLLNGAAVSVAAMDWADPRASDAFADRDAYDVVLASECVLPQLYPLGPLVACLDACLGDGALGLLAVEQRTFPAFDPKARFAELCAARGLAVATVPDCRLDAKYRADDIELWEVTRGAAPPAPAAALVVRAWGRGTTVLDVAGETVTLEEDAAGGIGAVTWPSALACARCFLGDLLPLRVGPGAKILELGAGTGLLSVVLAKLGCDVRATDVDRHVGRLARNLAANGASAKAATLVWGAPLPADLPAVDVVVCCDCAYDSTVVDALAATVAALWARPEPPAHLVVANERRTSLELLLRALAKRGAAAPLLVPLLDAGADLWRVDCAPPAGQPPPVAIYTSAPPPADD